MFTREATAETAITVDKKLAARMRALQTELDALFTEAAQVSDMTGHAEGTGAPTEEAQYDLMLSVSRLREAADSVRWHAEKSQGAQERHLKHLESDSYWQANGKPSDS